MIMKMLFFLSSLLILAFSLYGEPSSFQWSFGFYSVIGEEYQTLPLSEAAQMKDGDRFRLLVSSEADAYCYILDEQPDGVLCQLFGDRLKAKDAIFVPSGDDEDCFVLGPPDGIEKIHILVSATRQEKLEQLTARLPRDADKASASRKTLDEVSRLRQSLASFTESPSKPAVMGAAIRFMEARAESEAVEFSGSSTYVKTIRISH
jgi:hypothetical protein